MTIDRDIVKVSFLEISRSNMSIIATGIFYSCSIILFQRMLQIICSQRLDISSEFN